MPTQQAGGCMLGVSKANIRKLVGSDVRTVVAEAQHLIWVHADAEGKYVVKSEENPEGKLSIIAVVGEGTLEGITYPLVLLCEIGLRRGKPYRRSRPYNKRRPWFSMTAMQYKAVAPRLFSILQKIADKRIGEWKFGNRKAPRHVTISLPRWSRRKRGMEIKKKQVGYLNSVRFSVLPKEELLIQDLYWAEANLNLDIIRVTQGLVYFIKQALAPFRWRRPRRKDFFSLKMTRLVKEKLQTSSLPMHLRRKLLKDKFSDSPYWPELCSVLGWDGEAIGSGFELLTTKPEYDLKKVQVRILPRPDGKYVMFEMFEHP